MKFGQAKDQVADTVKKIKSKINHPSNHKAKTIVVRILKVLAALTLLFVITGCIVVVSVSIYVARSGSNELIDIRSMELSYTTILYETDSTGKNVELTRLYGDENRIWVDLKDIPSNIIEATISVEDERFLDHNGVDWKRTIGAFVNLVIPIYSSQQGGSTITQQLVKNVTQDKEASGIAGIQRKLKEIIRALVLESRYTKEDILEAYLNTMPFSNNTVGIQAASNLYFGKNVAQLTLAEAASLVGVTKSPETYNPLTNPESNKQRQEHILNLMLEQEKITQQQYDEAVAQKLDIKTKEVEAKAQQVQSYFVDQVTSDVIAGLMKEYGYNQQTAQDIYYRGGYRIYTTINSKIQEDIETVFENLASFPTYKTTKQPESAMVIMDFEGNVRGIVGGRGPKTGARVLNRATQATRPIGSTMKPIGVYGPAIEYNLITWSTLFTDSSTEIIGDDGKKTMFPNNYNNQFDGNLVVEDALEVSKNTIPFKIELMLKPQTTYDFLSQRLGITTLVKAKQVGTKTLTDISAAPMALGALTDGITPEELTAAYAVFGNGGVYYKPRTYTKVLDAEGNVVLNNVSQFNRAFSAESAEVMNKLLQNVVNGPNGTGRTSRFGTWPLAGKTGTAADNKDQWWAGMSPYYVGVVWLGYDEPQAIPLQGRHPSIDAWTNVMKRVHTGLTVKQFPTTGKLIQQNYCRITGKLAGATCTDVAPGWYKADNKPDVCSGDHANPAPLA